VSPSTPNAETHHQTQIYRFCAPLPRHLYYRWEEARWTCTLGGPSFVKVVSGSLDFRCLKKHLKDTELAQLPLSPKIMAATRNPMSRPRPSTRRGLVGGAATGATLTDPLAAAAWLSTNG